MIKSFILQKRRGSVKMKKILTTLAVSLILASVLLGISLPAFAVGDSLDYGRIGHHLAAVFRKERYDIIFGLGEMDFLALQKNLSCIIVYFKFLERKASAGELALIRTETAVTQKSKTMCYHRCIKGMDGKGFLLAVFHKRPAENMFHS
jgi:hypothetical protein